jgi:hypothetical protein
VETFLAGRMDPALAAQLLSEYHVRYVLWEAAQASMTEWSPEKLPNSQLVYANLTCKIYEIIQ